MIGVGREGPRGQLAEGRSAGGSSGERPGEMGEDRHPGRATTAGTGRPAGAVAPSAGPGARPAVSATRRGGPGVLCAEHAAWAVLASVEGLGPIGLVQLVNACGGAAAALAAAAGTGGETRVAEALGQRTGRGLAARIVAAAGHRARIAEAVQAAGLTVLTLDDGAYPDLLRSIELPPPVLFVAGHAAALSAATSVAVVGTRRPTDGGRAVAARLAGTIARTGAVVVSGLAAGIDGVAHAATLGVGGITVAVLGGGHASAITRRHRGLAERIVETGGAVVSEHAPATAPSRGTFPRRNRVISGLARATIVVEAGARSGALITAGWALEQGRECFVVPGPIDAPMSAGCLELLRAYPGQVRVVAGAAALVEDLGLDTGAGAAAGVGPGASPRETTHTRGSPAPAVGVPGPTAVLATLPAPVQAVARALVGGARTLDHAVAACDLTVPGTLAALTMLEDLGLVVAAYGRYRLSGELADLG